MGQKADYVARIGRRIRQARLEKGWSQHDLAQAIGVHDNQVSHWERGVHQPIPRNLERVADALGVPAEFFLRDP